VFGTGKAFFINLKNESLTMITEIGHHSLFLILGSSSSFFLQLLVLEFLLNIEARLKGWDKTDLAIWQSFFTMIFPLLNSTPTPPFIG
jgi:hypothetical protein